MKLAMAVDPAAGAAPDGGEGHKAGGRLARALAPLMCHHGGGGGGVGSRLRHHHNHHKAQRAQSIVSASEVTPGSAEIWSDLPELIRNDPSLAPFRDRYERQHGSKIPISASDSAASLESHNPSRSVPSSVVSLANGAPAQHKLSSSSDNNNIGSNNAYYNKTIENVETGAPTIVPALARPLGDELPDDKTFLSKITNQVHRQSLAPKVSFVSGTLETSPSTVELNPKEHGQHPHSHSPHEHDEADDGRKPRPWINNIKIAMLLVCWIIFTLAMMLKREHPDMYKPISIPVNMSRSFLITDKPIPKGISITLDGPFVPEQHGNITKSSLKVWLEFVRLEESNSTDDSNQAELNFVPVNNKSTEVWHLTLLPEDKIESFDTQEFDHDFRLDSTNISKSDNIFIRIMISSDYNVITPLTIRYNTKPIDIEYGILYAAAVLMLLYVLIIFEIVHRTFAAMIASTLSIGILAALDQRPSTAAIISWIDMETLLLLFSMMVIVAILSETGIFDFLAVYAYKVTAGRVWPLINCLCLFTAVMSSFLDNVTTVLLMTPVTIRLCEVMELNPVPILMSMVIFSNIGGTLTPVGDPPNVIIASNSRIQEAGIDFATFTAHMFGGILLVVVQTYFHLRLYYRDMNSLRHSEPKEIRELRHEISIWQHAAASLSSYSKDEDLVRVTLMKKVNRLLVQLKKKVNSGKVAKETYKATLQELMDKYPIRNKVLLIKSAVAVSFVIIFFFLHSFPQLRLSLGWTALLGALLLLILADRNDMEAVLARVEWSTLLFFAALFILMEALSKLGLISWIGKQTENIIMSVSEDSRLTVAILLILWVSAIASAFVDNIPLTTMMIRIALDLGDNPELNLPLQPLVWALAFGACLGGNGTLIGASANVVCAGVAEQHGYRFSFMEYFKIGFPVMLGSITVITGYLIVCHVAIGWNGLY